MLTPDWAALVPQKSIRFHFHVVHKTNIQSHLQYPSETKRYVETTLEDNIYSI